MIAPKQEREVPEIHRMIAPKQEREVPEIHRMIAPKQGREVPEIHRKESMAYPQQREVVSSVQPMEGVATRRGTIGQPKPSHGWKTL